MVCLHLVDLLPGQSGAEIVVKSTQFVHIYGYIHRSVNSIFEVAFSKFWSRPILYHVDTDDSPTDVDKRTVHTKCSSRHHHHHHHHDQSVNREGRWGTKDDFATSFLHFSLFSTALWDLPISRLVHSLMLSSHLFLCLPCLLPPFAVPLQDGFCQTWCTGEMTIPLKFASVYDGQKIPMWSNCLLDLGTDFLVGSMVFVWDV